MYPVVRLIKERFKFARHTLGPLDVHVSHHICWPWDLDPWMELNNGRTLTLYDLGRIPLMLSVGIVGAVSQHRWGMTVAGSTVRYRRRVRMFHRVEMRSRIIGWDHRFFYVEQAIWRNGEALNNLLVRMAVTNEKGIMNPLEVWSAMGHADLASPALPAWVKAWIEAENQRPWPPVV